MKKANKRQITTEDALRMMRAMNNGSSSGGGGGIGILSATHDGVGNVTLSANVVKLTATSDGTGNVTLKL